MKIRFFIPLLFYAACFAQEPPTLDTNGVVQRFTSGGLVVRGQIVKLNSAGQVVPVATTDTSGAIGIAATSQNNSGQGVLVSINGAPLVQVDGACAAGNVVSISTTTAGAGHCAASASGQTIGSAINASSPGSNFWFVQIGGLASGASGGTTSPSSLSTFFNKYYGLSPQDCGNATCTIAGAKGDTHVYFDCGMTTNNHVTCGSSHFASTDVNKWIESCASSCTSGPTINQGTITAFNSATDVTVSVTAGTTYTNTRTAFGTDDDAAMQNWATFMSQAPVLGAPPSTRGGYLPQGGYAIKQPLQIKYPGCATQGSCTQGEGGPNAGGTATLRPSLWIAGQGTASTFIYVRTAGVFTWPTQASNTAAVYVKDFDFSVLQNFAVIADTSAHNTTGITSPGVPAGIMNDNSTHAAWQNLWIQGFHNTTNSLCGFVNSQNDFESTYSYSAFEDSDFNACVGADGNGAKTMEKVSFINDFHENPLTGAQNLRVGGGTSLTLKQMLWQNCHFLSGNTAQINFLNTATSGSGETVEFVGGRASNVAAGSPLGIVTNGTPTLTIDFHGFIFEDTVGAAGNLVIDNTDANATINIYGGEITCTSCTNAFNNAGNIFVYGAALSGPTVANVQTGAGFTYGFFPHAGAGGGFDGGGYVQVSKLKSLTNCSVNSVSPAACGSASAGGFVVPTTTTTYTVNTTIVAAASRIHLQPITFAADLPSAPTCVAPAAGAVTISAISAGTSFTFALPSTTGQTCWYYTIEN